MIVYISIGNTDNKLNHKEWEEFVTRTDVAIRSARIYQVHGHWHSIPPSRYVNAVWCIEISEQVIVGTSTALKAKLSRLADFYNQNYISWAEVGKQVFIEP